MSIWEYGFERRRIGYCIHDISHNLMAAWTARKLFSGQRILDMLSKMLFLL
jgi:hypothetical protein